MRDAPALVAGGDGVKSAELDFRLRCRVRDPGNPTSLSPTIRLTTRVAADRRAPREHEATARNERTLGGLYVDQAEDLGRARADSHVPARPRAGHLLQREQVPLENDERVARNAVFFSELLGCARWGHQEGRILAAGAVDRDRGWQARARGPKSRLPVVPSIGRLWARWARRNSARSAACNRTRRVTRLVRRTRGVCLRRGRRRFQYRLF